MSYMMERKDIITLLSKRDGPDCFLCKKPFLDDEITLDHWQPKSVAFAAGWSVEQVNDLSNLRLSHRECNAAKGDLVPNSDGTLPERPKKTRALKVPRPTSCDTCMNGRILLLGEICPDCSSGPQPIAFPKTLQRIPRECDHVKFHCWMCVIGHIPRKSAFQAIIMGE